MHKKCPSVEQKKFSYDDGEDDDDQKIQSIGNAKLTQPLREPLSLSADWNAVKPGEK